MSFTEHSKEGAIPRIPNSDDLVANAADMHDQRSDGDSSENFFTPKMKSLESTAEKSRSVSGSAQKNSAEESFSESIIQSVTPFLTPEDKGISRSLEDRGFLSNINEVDSDEEGTVSKCADETDQFISSMVTSVPRFIGA